MDQYTYFRWKKLIRIKFKNNHQNRNYLQYFKFHIKQYLDELLEWKIKIFNFRNDDIKVEGRGNEGTVGAEVRIGGRKYHLLNKASAFLESISEPLSFACVNVTKTIAF